jgi:type I restriction enzyme S subunit
MVFEEQSSYMELPEGWSVARIEEICEPPQYGWTTSAENNRPGLKLLRTSDISAEAVNWSSVPVCKEEPEDPEKYLLKSGDIVVSRAGSVGLSYLVKNPPRAIFASYLIRFRPKPPLGSEFIALFLRSPEYWSAIAEEAAGIAIPNVNASKLKRIKLPLAPLSEQKRIVAKIEELLAQVNAARARLAKVTRILKRFRQAVLAAACSGRLTEDWRHKNPTARISTKIGEGNPPDEIEIPESWNWFLSAQEFSVVTSGSRGWAKYYADDGPIFIRIGNLNHDSIEIDLKSVQHVRPRSNAEGLRTRVRVGDILISITADVGMIALIDADIGEAYINQHVALARPIGEFDRRYLAYFLAAMNGGQRQFQNLQRGATKVGLGLDDIRSVWIARPPIEEQHEIVRRVEALFTLADTIEKRVGAATKRAEKLTQAILAKAFRGELVPTEAELARREGRDYEPASVLLARIKAERERSTQMGDGMGVRRRRRKGRS